MIIISRFAVFFDIKLSQIRPKPLYNNREMPPQASRKVISDNWTSCKTS